MVSFKCSNCGYKFMPKDKAKAEPPKTCPYCNRQNTVMKEKSASEILDELTGSD